MIRGLVWTILAGGMVPACSGDGGQAREAAPLAEAPAARVDAEAADPAPEPPSDARILSAYYGLDKLPPAVLQACPPASVRKNGLPVTFSVRLRGDTLEPADFRVETATGEAVTPVCATLLPADEALERRTVLLAGAFGSPEAPPRAVEVVGSLQDTQGKEVRGARTTTVTPLQSGPSLVLAERYDPATPGLAGECPPSTKQVVQLVWEGGVTGADGAELGEAQRQAVSVTLEDGSTVTPAALADDDPDNFVHACLDVATPATSVSVEAGHFHDPGDDANPKTQAEVVEGAT